MSMARVRTIVSLAATLLGGAAMAGPLTPSIDPHRDMGRYDVSFQDGRTTSQIGTGPYRMLALSGAHGLPESGDPDDQGPLSMCYDRKHPPSPEVMQQLEDAMHGGYQGRYLIGGSWNGAANTVLTLTWSFVPDGLSIPGGGVAGEATAPSVLFARMDSLFGGNRALWVSQFQSCFDRWGALSGVSYVRVKDVANDDWDDGAAWGSNGSTNRGMCRISMHNIDNVNNVLAYCAFPTNGDMVLDSSENWASSAGTYRFLRNVVMHEHGHGLGFQHVCPANGTKLMEPFIDTDYDGPQQDDMRAVEYNYGDPYEPNNTAGTAFDLGTLAPGSTTTLGLVPNPGVTNSATLCISNTSDLDYFKITLADPKLADITVTPVGSSYAMYVQDQACNNGVVNDNSLTGADLTITVFASNGTTVLRTQNATAAGAAETISGLMLPSGISYVRINGSSVTEAQLYRLSVAIRTTSLAPNATDGIFTDHVHVSWPAIADATSYQVYRNINNATFGGTTAATITPPTTTFDDTNAVPGQLYYYLVRVIQPGNTGYRFMTDTGDSGYINVPPTADAGPDQTVVDSDNNGSEPVTLDGSASFHVGEGSILLYSWSEGTTSLGDFSDPTTVVTLALGQHTITLNVTDNSGFHGIDTVVINVVPPTTGGCGSADFNCDGDIGTDSDISAFFACISGNCPAAPCHSTADFNGDGDTGTDSDIEAFFRVLGGGT